MKIMQFMGAALMMTTLGGAVALADTLPAQQPQQLQQPMATQQSDRTELPTLAANNPQIANVLGAPQVDQKPQHLQFANFGQWDEAASEN